MPLQAPIVLLLKVKHSKIPPPPQCKPEQRPYQQGMVSLHAIKLVGILEEGTAIISQELVTLLILVWLLHNHLVDAVVLLGRLE